MKTVSVNILLDRAYIIPNSIKPNWDSKLKNNILLVKKNNKETNVHVVLHLVKEHYQWDNIDNYFIPIMNRIMDECSIVDFNYVFNRVGSSYSYKNASNILFVEYFAMQTHRLINEGVHPYNKSWNTNTDKGLFLVGKPNKMNRLPILYHLYKKEILDKFEWSLYIDDDIVNSIKKSNLLELNETELAIFLEHCGRKPDKAPIKLNKTIEGDVVHDYSGFPFDPSLYENTFFSLISETEFNDSGSIFITEKTWRTIVNKHPFIMAGTVNMLSHLKSLGFRTFDKYLPISDYDSIANNRDRLDAILINLSYDFRDKIEEINDDVEYNFQHFAKFAQGEFARLENLYMAPESAKLARFLIDIVRYGN
jgi:hypothetical protein